MKLLIYNWAAFDGPQGGGVSVYLKRLIPHLVNRGIKVVTLSLKSGKLNSSPRVIASNNCFSSQGVESFVLQGTEIPFPYRRSFGYSGFFNAQNTENAVLEFISDSEFNVVHFHGIEGLPPSVLRLGNKLPSTKVFFTAHNYHLLCQQLQLFRLSTMAPCDNFAKGVNCVGCLEGGTSVVSLSGTVADHYPRAWRLISSVKQHLLYLKSCLVNLRARWSFQQHKENSGVARSVELNQAMVSKAKGFYFWRQYNLDTLRNYPLSFITVSNLARDKFLGMGVPSAKIDILPPATDQKFSPLERKKVHSKSDRLCVSFWGYSTPSKGLSIFIDALIELISTRNVEVEVMIVSNLQGKYTKEIDRLRILCDRITLIGTYDQESFQSLCEKTDLAIVGALWDETYSQVAAELHLAGIPLLASSKLGFANQYIKDENFLFHSDSPTDLSVKIGKFIDEPNLIQSYWANDIVLDTFVSNADGLYQKYEQFDWS